MLIDTHCHLDMDDFDPDRDEVIRQAKDAGVHHIINIGSDREGNIKGLKLSAQYPQVYSSVGIHPHNADTLNEELYKELKMWAGEPKVVAIGEIGLDYHYLNSPKEVQIEAFRNQIAIAKDLALPIIVHSREAKEDTLRILKEDAEGVKGVLHCFSGGPDMAKKAMDMGFYISIAGPVTFENAKNLREIVKLTPDEFLLIETDAPYLSPVPMRGKRNEPSFLRYIAETIASLRGVSLSDIERITTLNAMRLFKIGEIPEKGEIAYQIRDSLYLNITNRCTNRCGFCIRFHTSYVKGHNLRLEREPSVEELINAIGEPKAYKEVVFCGLGEPLLRLEVVKDVSRWIKEREGAVRINTNGHGNLIHGRNILPELQGIVDSISVSLDAEDEIKYEEVCKPLFKDAFQAVISFIKEAKKYIPHVKTTVVGVQEVNINKCKALADELAVELRIREFNVVG